MIAEFLNIIGFIKSELTGLITIGISVNTFVNGVWLLLYNSQNKRIDELKEEVKLINQKLFKGE